MTTGNALPSNPIPAPNGQEVAAWVPEAREVLPELTEEFEHETFPPKPVHFVSMKEKLTGGEWEALKAYGLQASIGEPEIAHGIASDD